MGKNLFQQRFESPGVVKGKAGESASLKIKTDEWLTEHHIKTLCAKSFFKAGDCVKILNFHCRSFLEGNLTVSRLFNAILISHLCKLILVCILFTAHQSLCVCVCVCVCIKFHYRSVHNSKNVGKTQVPISR